MQVPQNADCPYPEQDSILDLLNKTFNSCIMLFSDLELFHEKNLLKLNERVKYLRLENPFDHKGEKKEDLQRVSDVT